MAVDSFLLGAERARVTSQAMQEAFRQAVEQQLARAALAKSRAQELLTPLALEADAATLRLTTEKAGEDLKSLPIVADTAREAALAQKAQAQLSRAITENLLPAAPTLAGAQVAQARAATSAAEAQQAQSEFSRGYLENLRPFLSYFVRNAVTQLQAATAQNRLIARQATGALDLQPVLQEADRILARYRVDLLTEDPSGGLLVLAQYFPFVLGRPVPTTSEGRVDVKALKEAAPKIAEKLAQQSAGGDAEKELIKVAVENGVQVLDANGQLRPMAEIQKDLAARKEKERNKLPATVEEEALTALDKAQASLQQAQELASMMFVQVSPTGEVESPTARENLVGPLAGTVGFGVSRFTNVDKFAKQRALQMFVNTLTQLQASQLKGALSNKELEFLRRSLPKITDPEKVWQNFFNQYIPTLRKAINRYQSFLKLPAEVREKFDNSVIVVSSVREARERLKSGTPFVLENDPTGEVYVVP